MKRLNANVPRNTISSVFVKFSVCFLFLGLAYRLFSSSLVQFSPVFVGKASPPQVVAETPTETTYDILLNLDGLRGSENVTEKCNLFIGEWIHDPSGPTYTNTTCDTIESHQNCMKNGRPDFDYVYWRWKPRDCDLPKFDPKKFLNLMRNKSLAFIGDSIMRNHVQSLLCMISKVEQAVDIYHDETFKNRKWSFPSYHFTVSVVWSPYLMKAVTFEDDNGVSMGITRLHLDEPDALWTQQYENFDYVVVAGGKWFLKSALYFENNTLVGCHYCLDTNTTELGFEYAYRKALNSTLTFISGSKHKPVVVFRTTAPDHFEKGEWNTGGYCNRTKPFKTGEIEIKDVDDIMHRIELEEFERVKAINVMSLKLLDATYLSLLRPDGHPGVYRQFQPFAGKDKNSKIQNDCLHWCLPGPIDSWNDLILEMLVNDSN